MKERATTRLKGGPLKFDGSGIIEDRVNPLGHIRNLQIMPRFSRLSTCEDGYNVPDSERVMMPTIRSQVQPTNTGLMYPPAHVFLLLLLL